jgi:hypothetical protein
MSVYVMLTTSHMDEVNLVRLKKALADYKTIDVVRTGLSFWIAPKESRVVEVPVIAVLCTKRNHLSELLDISHEARVALHLAESSEDSNPDHFVSLEHRRAVDLLEGRIKPTVYKSK